MLVPVLVSGKLVTVMSLVEPFFFVELGEATYFVYWDSQYPHSVMVLHRE